MTADSGVLDQVTLQFLHALKQDTNYMQVAAQHLFYYLVLIQLSISSLWMVLAGEPLQSFIYKLIQMAFSFGFFYAMISLGTTWLPEIINGFINIGQSGGVTSLDPDAILQQGISIANAILKGFYNWGLLSHPFISIVGAIICLGIIVLYALIAAELVLTLAKSYIVVSVNSLFFAFSGLKLTQPITYTFIQAIISIGLQLMTLYLLIGVGQTLGFNWAELTKTAAEQHELTPMLVIWAAAILYFMLIRHIPPYVAQLALFPFAAQHAGSSTIPVLWLRQH